ncbi:unnamed protein product, partial [Didymodactylos carnosus]
MTLSKLDGRTKDGQKRRRANTAKLKQANEQLKNKVKQLESVVRQLRNVTKSASPQSTPSKKRDSSSECPISPSTLLYQNISPRARKRATKRIIDRKHDLPRGTNAGFRRQFGVNLSNTYLSVSPTMSTLKTQTEEFLCQGDVSKICLDKKKMIDGHQ